MELCGHKNHADDSFKGGVRKHFSPDTPAYGEHPMVRERIRIYF